MRLDTRASTPPAAAQPAAPRLTRQRCTSSKRTTMEAETFEFPELVGLPAEEAKEKILAAHPELNVQVRAARSMNCMHAAACPRQTSA